MSEPKLKDTTPAKKPKADKTKKPKDSTEKILHAYHFTEKELREQGQEVARLTQDINTLKDQAKSAAADFKSRIDAKESARNAVSNKLTGGYEMREILAIVQYDPKRSKKVYLHPKTRAVLSERDMTVADWQLPMFTKEEMDATKDKDDAPKHNTTDTDPLAEAAAKNSKVDLLESDDELRKLAPKKVIALFKKEAASANWDRKTVGYVVGLAEARITEGTGNVLATLKPYIVEK